MLSGEGTEISKKATLHVQLTKVTKRKNSRISIYIYIYIYIYICVYISLPLFCRTTTCNFQKLPSYTFYEGNAVLVLVHFFSLFSLPLIFTLVAASTSHFLTAAKSFFSSFQQRMPPLFLSLTLALYRQACVATFIVELRWPVAYSLFFSVFLFLYIPNLWTWKLI